MKHNTLTKNIKGIETKCVNIKKSLESLYEDIKNNYDILQAMFDNPNISKEDKSLYKNEYNLYRELSQRNVIDRITLQRLNILVSPPSKNNVKTMKRKGSNTILNQIGKIASLIRTDKMTESDKTIIASVLENLQNELGDV
jgi:uncharacterized membrane protein YgaE (UPF0421/DUF939 family)